MKTKQNTVLFFALALLLAVGLGCGFVDQATGPGNTNANKSLTDKAVDTAVGQEKIGIPECDEVMDLLTAEANNPDDNFVVKAAKGVVVNKIKETIRTSIEENQTDRAQIAKDCTQAKTEFEKYKAGQGKQ
ncbi:MAG TPA: hypothetical protein VNA17_04855 [Pyrinomonadaceae bacterium]|nr:hypothetical protein [Pyrinomonadaceae bacterium]